MKYNEDAIYDVDWVYELKIGFACDIMARVDNSELTEDQTYTLPDIIDPLIYKLTPVIERIKEIWEEGYIWQTDFDEYSQLMADCVTKHMKALNSSNTTETIHNIAKEIFEIFDWLDKEKRRKKL